MEAQSHSEQWLKDEGRYIPHPATWINGRRWEDEQPISLAEDILQKDTIITSDIISSMSESNSRSLEEIKNLPLEDLL